MNESPNELKRAQVSNFSPGLLVSNGEVERLFATLDKYGGFDAPSGEFSIAFLSKEEISRIHQQFMDDPSETDVITFPGDQEEGQAGEICVCPEVAADYAESHESTFAEELALYLAHGYLHLCGFDDKDDSNRSAMRKAESIAMDTLAAHDAIPKFKLERSRP